MEDYTTAMTNYIKNHDNEAFANQFKNQIHNSYYDEFKSTVNGMLEEFIGSYKFKSVSCKSICTKKYSKYIVEYDDLIDQTNKLTYNVKEGAYEIAYGTDVNENSTENSVSDSEFAYY